MHFASDNAGPVPQEVLDALAAANTGYAMPYGNDPVTARVRDRIRELFEAPGASVHLVATGTAANALALATLVEPWQTVFCHRTAHVEEDECGAPEFFAGAAKLTLVDGPDGKMDPAALAAAIAESGAKGVHGVQPGAVTITQPTERGTVHSLDEIRALAGVARENGLPVHMDGARFANAVAALGCSAAEMTWKAGIDAVSFGGTKNGLMGVEAVILFDAAPSWEFELRRKRGAHLFSKHRYLAAQMEAFLDRDLWLRLAARANAAAARLAAGLATVPGARLLHPADANMVFAGWPRAGHRRAREAGATYYLWPFGQALDGPDDEVLTARLVCDWSMTDAEVDRFLTLLRG